MKRLFIPTTGPGDWRRLLADPERHWVKGHSALELAVAWEAARGTARGLPSTVATLLDSHPRFSEATLLAGIPEHQVALDGGGHASQTDLWTLLRGPHGLISMAVEAKAGESFDKTIDQWLADADVGALVTAVVNVLKRMARKPRIYRYLAASASPYLVWELVKCGKPSCRCSKGARHGPYSYLRWEDWVIHLTRH